MHHLTVMEFPIILYLLFACTPLHSTALDSFQEQTYIVHVRRPASAVLTSSDHTSLWYQSFLPATTAATSSDESTSRVVHTYNHIITGFAARLTELEVIKMSAKADFLHAYPDRRRPLLTTNTPRFLGLNLHTGLWSKNNLGEGVIIGVLDSGVDPTHPSFRGDGMPPPPAKWKGKCEFNSSLCNNKLIGARTFLSGAREGPVNDDGHGTHTASTAAGAFVRGAEVMGNAKGTAVGMAPRAHLAIYQVCAIDDCADSDILAGMDAAVADGVDVLSISLGTVSPAFYNDAVALGSFGAIQKGVFVSCAAGNSGPAASTLSNDAPWILTVAASTLDRTIQTSVELGNGLILNGESLFQPETFGPAMYPLVYAGAGANPNATFCGNGTLSSSDVTGKIVLCERGGDIARIEKGDTVKKAGGVGMILMNEVAGAFSTEADPHVLPASHVSHLDGTKIKDYINSTSHPTAAIRFRGTVLGTRLAPAIASFSSRGPSTASPGILKPDITAPGVSILAAWPFPLDASNLTTGLPVFNIISGTSMSTPHLSGIAALIKSKHPSWSPAAIKSAIMTTANILDDSGKPIVDERHHPANLFAVGAGHVNPEKASDPGLVYDLAADDYIPYLCGLGYSNDQVDVIVGGNTDCSTVKKITEGELNYPSFSVALGGANTSVTVARTVKNVGEADSVYWIKVDAPAGVSVVVEPERMQFSEVDQEEKFWVTFNVNGHGGVMVSEGYLSWVSKTRTVRSPISVSFKN